MTMMIMIRQFKIRCFFFSRGYSYGILSFDVRRFSPTLRESQSLQQVTSFHSEFLPLLLFKLFTILRRNLSFKKDIVLVRSYGECCHYGILYMVRSMVLRDNYGRLMITSINKLYFVSCTALLILFRDNVQQLMIMYGVDHS